MPPGVIPFLRPPAWYGAELTLDLTEALDPRIVFTRASTATYDDGLPALDLDVTTALPGAVTFTRGSTATYWS